ncbi:Tat proofreading chaperone DmsD [Rahnella bonaserana]|jgi:putative dimethyl sulfoxide reductase chaperone|uniref:Tat proofreading chaperone DmsD n=1 Tax=Rahnella bonaserana TaxID=2816248 RepID=A0ABS6M2H9_9GAMM|nr:Tat proofreading chaperone DmsD [Rahnella bonaserana]MBU9858068.1 Tat proofreading chaperone DmsD [Rahnella bonaserana]MCL9642038.1 Tat proofreading chaperone DmsD [Rahnella victoriana]WHZ42107.1 Tat proofreading chaperone DmsD [Rahnella bonaserana]
MSAESISLTGKILGAIFFYPPDSPEVQPLISLLQDSDWAPLWPCASQDAKVQVTEYFSQINQAQESLGDAYQRLFVGPYALPAPPWGSVYLDKESVVFGDSTLALRQWMRENGIEPHLTQAEPEDHIGLLLMMSAWLAENSPALLNEFLTMHLLPWAGHYLELLRQNAEHPFYVGVAILAESTLCGWKQQQGLEVNAVDLYFR